MTTTGTSTVSVAWLESQVLRVLLNFCTVLSKDFHLSDAVAYQLLALLTLMLYDRQPLPESKVLQALQVPSRPATAKSPKDHINIRIAQTMVTRM